MILKSHIQNLSYPGGAWAQSTILQRSQKFQHETLPEMTCTLELMWSWGQTLSVTTETKYICRDQTLFCWELLSFLDLDACFLSTCAVCDTVSTDPPGKRSPASTWCRPHQLGTSALLVLILLTPTDAWCFLGLGLATSEVLHWAVVFPNYKVKLLASLNMHLDM